MSKTEEQTLKELSKIFKDMIEDVSLSNMESEEALMEEIRQEIKKSHNRHIEAKTAKTGIIAKIKAILKRLRASIEGTPVGQDGDNTPRI